MREFTHRQLSNGAWWTGMRMIIAENVGVFKPFYSKGLYDLTTQ